MAFFLIHAILLYAILAHSQSTQRIPFTPLAAKNPYLNAWFHNNNSAPAMDWPVFFTGVKVLGWAGFVRVDGQAYQWLGKGYNPSKTVMNTITPTKTIFRIEAGPIQFNATFFTPIEPNDYVRQSIPFSYLYVDGFSFNDTASRSVQFYSDTSAEWVSSDIAEGVEWYTVEEETTTYHYTTRQNGIPMEDNHDIADDSTLYYAARKRSGSAWQTGNSGALRSLFIEHGTLDNARDTDFRPINAEGFPGFSHSVDLGTISSTAQPDPVVWAIGLVRNPLIRYTSLSRDQTGYYWSVHPNISSVITAFLNDFEDARSRSVALDATIMSTATEVSSEYADIVSLLTRQIFASLDITLEKTEGGNIDPSATKIFMKDMGVSTRTNPVDVMYGAFPAFVYFNATIARDLLLPYFELQENSPYAAPDIGTKYPTISDPTDPDPLAMDNTGSMLIMAYAHAVKSGDGSLVSRYYPTLQRWADFLVSTTLNPPPGSRTIDDFPGPGKANLVIKGILAIFSMAKMNEATGSSNTTYMDHAIALYQNWTQQAVTETHIKYIYDVPESWGLMYNLFPDIWLNMNMISNDTLTHQADFYKNQTGEQSALGVQNFHNDTVFPHWTRLTAATIPDNMSDIRDQFISSIHQRVFNGSEYFSLPIKYKSSTGEGIGGGASGSAMFGTAYGLLARSQANVDFVVHPYSPPPDPLEILVPLQGEW